MRRACDVHDLVLYGPALTLQGLLEVRLVVVTLRVGCEDAIVERRDDRRAGRLEAVREEDRGDRGLRQRRQDTRLAGELLDVELAELAAVLGQPPSEAETVRDVRAGRPRDDVRLQPREAPLVGVRIAAAELVGDRKPEDRVAEELEPLVGAPAIGMPGGVRVDPGALRGRERVDQAAEVSWRARRCSPRPRPRR